jgi:beta-lactamase regulating signal transducer with metallopeptidase domain
MLSETASLSIQAETWINVLIDASVKGAVLLALAAVFALACRRASASARHTVWSLAVGALLLLPLLSLTLPALPVPVKMPAAQSEPEKKMGETVAPRSAPSLSKQNRTAAPAVITPEVVDALSETAVTASVEAASSSLGWPVWALLIWIAGAFAIFARLLAGAVNLWWMVRRARPVTQDSWNGLAHFIAFQLGLARPVRLLESERVSMPMTCGAFRSVVLLPVDAEDWSDERRAVVLSHELAHVKRRDCLTQMLAHFVCALHWFNPLVWIAARQLRVERERACDDHVLNIGTKASDYASHLLDIARGMQSMKGTFMAAVAMAKPSQLEGRLLAILDPKLRRRNLSRAATAAVAIALASVALPLAAMRPSAHTKANGDPLSIEALTADNQKSSTPQPKPKPSPESSKQAGATPAPAEDETDPVPDPDPKDADQEKKPDEKIDQAVKEGVASALKEALKDADAGVREQAIHSLGLVGGSEAAAVLIEALRDSDAEVRERAAWALGLRGGQSAIEPLIAALKDQSPDVREQAAWSLGMKGDKRAVEPLMAALGDASASVREQAAWSLGMRGDSRSVDALIKALSDSDEDVREQSAWALGMRGDQRALDALKSLLKDKSSGVREQAAWALGMILMRRGGDSDKD